MDAISLRLNKLGRIESIHTGLATALLFGSPEAEPERQGPPEWSDSAHRLTVLHGSTEKMPSAIPKPVRRREVTETRLLIQSLATDTGTWAPVNWRAALPILGGSSVMLRELDPSDAPSLFLPLSAAEVTRFISPPPPTVDGFLHFINWARSERSKGAQACYAVVPRGLTQAVGFFQIRGLQEQAPTLVSSGEWGFALGTAWWGSGAFAEAAALVMTFAFERLGLNRLEARAAVANGRGNGALRKLGAVQEAVLRRSFVCQGAEVDQVLWSVIASEWRQSNRAKARRARIH